MLNFYKMNLKKKNDRADRRYMFAFKSETSHVEH